MSYREVMSLPMRVFWQLSGNVPRLLADERRSMLHMSVLAANNPEGASELFEQLGKHAKALIGYLPETPPLYRELTVDEFLTVTARLHGISSKAIKSAVDRAKQRCGLTEMSKRLIENLSKGYQQRVGIAQAIIHNPMVVILDEPTVGLDPIQIRDIRTLIKELGKEHSVILSTHILPEVEIVCDHVQIIDKGQLIFNGSIDLLKK